MSWDPDQPLELNTGKKPDAEDATHFSIQLRAFSPAVVNPANLLAQAFSIEESRAQAIVSSLPKIITQHVSKDAGTAYLRRLTQMGAVAELLPEPLTGIHMTDTSLNLTQPDVGLGDVFTHGLPEPQPNVSIPNAPTELSQDALPLPDMPLPDFSAPPSQASLPRSQVSAMPPARGPILDAPPKEHPGFWNRMHLAPMVPLHGDGLVWLGMLFATSMLLGILAAIPILGWIAFPFAALAYCGFTALYFGAATDSGSQDEGESLPEISYNKPDRSPLLVLGFVTLLAAAILYSPAVYLAYQGAHEGVILLGSMILYIYFPMGVAVMGLANSPFQILNPLLVGRAIFAAGMPYFVVVMFGLIVNGGMTLLKGFIMSIAAKLGDPTVYAIVAALVAITSGILFCYAIGMQGYLLGCVFGDNPEAFEFLEES